MNDLSRHIEHAVSVQLDIMINEIRDKVLKEALERFDKEIRKAIAHTVVNVSSYITYEDLQTHIKFEVDTRRLINDLAKGIRNE